MAKQFIILVSKEGAVRGPFTHDEPPQNGESLIVLTSDQLAAFNEVRSAYPGASFSYDGKTFAPSKVSKARLGLREEYSKLSRGEQLLFKNQMEAVKTLLDEDNLEEARKIIYLSGHGMPETFNEARDAMLAVIDMMQP